ncbi:MAG TPA: hypothetical protein VFA45_23130 [Actinomycetes bacterium]|nr:hypothetical protein [Actinomycetes bacterium]
MQGSRAGGTWAEADAARPGAYGAPRRSLLPLREARGWGVRQDGRPISVGEVARHLPAARR